MELLKRILLLLTKSNDIEPGVNNKKSGLELLQSRLLLFIKLNDIEPDLNNENLVWN